MPCLSLTFGSAPNSRRVSKVSCILSVFLHKHARCSAVNLYVLSPSFRSGASPYSSLEKSQRRRIASWYPCSLAQSIAPLNESCLIRGLRSKSSRISIFFSDTAHITALRPLQSFKVGSAPFSNSNRDESDKD